MVMADILGAAVFLVLAVIFTIDGLNKSKKGGTGAGDSQLRTGQTFALIFSALAVAVALVINK